MTGTVYLLHFDATMPRDRGTIASPVGHYLGFATHLGRRIRHHREGRGARITQALVQRGVGFDVARTWQGDRGLERRLKNRHDHRAFCPTCRGGFTHRAEATPCDGCTRPVCRHCQRHLTRVLAGSPRAYWRHVRRIGCR